ncbi:MAG TPA: folylpolyglutamate synthase/dihydrofolate synthase family protein [Chitinophagaceae bacterium]
MTYGETIDYLFQKLPMFSRIGSAAFKKDLTNITILCQHLGNPQERFKSLHIGGTNGKGSVSHMMAAVLHQQGYKTGLYTSPHLYDFRERIKVNGEMVSEAFVIEFVEKLKPVIEEIEPSFFEITVAMAFQYFAASKVDVAIIEVGLGGRLDSTNIIKPIVSVITNIGLDHMNMLGDTLGEIAFEKAGIIKEKTPVVIGEKHKETDPIFIEIAEKKKAPLYFAEDDFQVKHYDWKGGFIQMQVSSENKLTLYQLDLPGIYQTKNLCTALEIIRQIEKAFPVSNEKIPEALKTVKGLTGLKGRWEVVHNHPTIVLEVAHNEPGISKVLQQLEQTTYNKLHIIFGMVKDKDPDPILSLLPKEARYYWTAAHIPRALEAESLRAYGVQHSLEGQSFPDVNDALVAARQNALPDDLILVCGSIFLVAEVNMEVIKTSVLQVR